MTVQSSTARTWLARLGPFLGLLAVIAIFAVMTDSPEQYLSIRNFRIVVAQTVIVALGAIGMTMIMVSGGIDLSVGSTIALTGVVTAIALRDGSSPLVAVLEGVLAGGIAVGDPIKTSTPGALAALRDDGLRIVMLTGDARATAQSVAKRLGIQEVIAEVQPADKSQVIGRLQSEGRRVAMVGDGINDAPALARADVGIAMGTGTDIAMESATVTLVSGDLSGIVKARRLSRATVRNIRQNLGFAFGYNALGIPIAAGVLYPFTGHLLSPIIAALAMSLSSISVITNALRLRGK